MRPKILGSKNAFCWAKRYNHLLKLMLESGPRPGRKHRPARCFRGQEDRCLTKKKRGDEASPVLTGGVFTGGTRTYDVPAVFVTLCCTIRMSTLGVRHPPLWGMWIQKRDTVRSVGIPKDDQPLK